MAWAGAVRQRALYVFPVLNTNKSTKMLSIMWNSILEYSRRQTSQQTFFFQINLVWFIIDEHVATCFCIYKLICFYNLNNNKYIMYLSKTK